MSFPTSKFPLFERPLGDESGGDWAKAGKLPEFEFPSGDDFGLVDIADEEDEPAGLVKREDASEDALESPPAPEGDEVERLVIRGVSQRFVLPEPRRRKLPPL